MPVSRRSAAVELRSDGAMRDGARGMTATSWDDSRRKLLLFRDSLECKIAICSSTTPRYRHNIPDTRQLSTWIIHFSQDRIGGSTSFCRSTFVFSFWLGAPMYESRDVLKAR